MRVDLVRRGGIERGLAQPGGKAWMPFAQRLDQADAVVVLIDRDRRADIQFPGEVGSARLVGFAQPGAEPRLHFGQRRGHAGCAISRRAPASSSTRTARSGIAPSRSIIVGTAPVRAITRA